MTERCSRGIKPLDTTITQDEIEACLTCSMPDCHQTDPDCQLASVRLEMKGKKRTYKRRTAPFYPSRKCAHTPYNATCF